MRYGLEKAQGESVLTVSVSIPAAAGPAVSVWSLISTALAALATPITDPMKVVGFVFKGTKIDNTSFGAFVFGGPDTTGNGGTNANSYVAAGADYDPKCADPRNVFVVAPAAGAATPRVIEVNYLTSG